MSPVFSESVSKFRDNYATVLKQVEQGPVLLLQNSKVAAILVAPEQWNALWEQLDNLQALVWSLQADLAVASGEDELEAFDPSEWEEVEDAVPVAA
jgi:PHD/YefM family antitoxin component YafN of YafNO toxin-antitoxin module